MKTDQDMKGLYRYELVGGWIVLAGRTDDDNDRLSLKMARPDDWWFHVKGMPGSHVILKARPDEKPGREIMKQAAGIAVYHSKARLMGMAGVVCTKAAHVSKPRGAKSGTVNIKNERVIKARACLPEKAV